ncbi:2-hydroxymuconic semialdehyde hydrolase [invertebrate metagenome]|uniref:Palmitoyl-protein thioesterase ABHD10, mitochondrial n=1 Tax=invertebrate metagenome TaxID=1711999 RepID=A0A484H6K1_9ZZZZ
MVHESDSALLAPRILSRQDGATIAYHKSSGRSPGLVYIHGLMSDMTGEKAVYLERWCQAKERAFIRFDCFGHGQSSGDFCDGTVGRWVDDTVAVLESLTDGPQVLVGSSIGGWVALLAALQWPVRVAGLVGIAAAADLTEDIWRRLSPAQRGEVMHNRVLFLHNHNDGKQYCISRVLIEDGRRHLLLQGRIAVACPIRLIHGLKDLDVPWQTVLRIQERVISPDVVMTLVKDGSHRLSRPQDLKRLIGVVAELMTALDQAG